jgi:hypothetical protein
MGVVPMLSLYCYSEGTGSIYHNCRLLADIQSWYTSWQAKGMNLKQLECFMHVAELGSFPGGLVSGIAEVRAKLGLGISLDSPAVPS